MGPEEKLIGKQAQGCQTLKTQEGTSGKGLHHFFLEKWHFLGNHGFGHSYTSERESAREWWLGSLNAYGEGLRKKIAPCRKPSGDWMEEATWIDKENPSWSISLMQGGFRTRPEPWQKNKLSWLLNTSLLLRRLGKMTCRTSRGR